MIGQFDFSEKGWLGGKGRSAKWPEVPFTAKIISPQYCMTRDNYHAAMTRDGEPKAVRGYKLAFMDVTSATNERTMVCSVVRDMPCGNSVPVLAAAGHPWPLVAALNSLGYDFVARRRCSGLHLNYFVVEDSPVPRPQAIPRSVGILALRLLGVSPTFADAWLRDRRTDETAVALRSLWAVTVHERMRLRVVADAAATALFGISARDLHDLIFASDRPVGALDEGSLPPNGFWRVDKDRDPELRHPVLTLVAFHDLEEKIRSCGGDRDAGLEAFLTQNDGEGWMLPETLRLADYGLGHDDRAKEPQPVASRLGPRYRDWQLAQGADESWRECHLHARNLLGEAGYQRLLAEIEAEKHGPGFASPVPADRQETITIQKRLFD